MRCEREKRAKIRRMTSFERFVSERENLVLNSPIYSNYPKLNYIKILIKMLTKHKHISVSKIQC